MVNYAARTEWAQPQWYIRKSTVPRRKNTLPPDVLRIYDKLSEFYNQRDSSGRKWCNARYGIYCFYDYDGEPIYVGQMKERLRTRINLHLTNQRTDAVAMLEVAESETDAEEDS